MKYKPPSATASFSMTIFYRLGGYGTLGPPPGSATVMGIARVII